MKRSAAASGSPASRAMPASAATLRMPSASLGGGLSASTREKSVGS
jgi:hypothetical protein